jgi:hypothetical protein
MMQMLSPVLGAFLSQFRIVNREQILGVVFFSGFGQVE